MAETNSMTLRQNIQIASSKAHKKISQGKKLLDQDPVVDIIPFFFPAAFISYWPNIPEAPNERLGLHTKLQMF